MAYKLLYFDGRGRAEPARFLFKYGGIDFQDVRLKQEDWLQLKEKTPFGQLPVLEHNGKQVAQSAAICRYIADIVKLTGVGIWENLEIDEVVDTVEDVIWTISTVYREQDEDKKKILKETVLNESIPYYLTRLDALVKKNKGFLALGRLTWADLYLASFGTNFDTFMGNTFEKYPNLQDLREKVETIPAIKQWIELRPRTEF